jgi:hypothetical protein
MSSLEVKYFVHYRRHSPRALTLSIAVYDRSRHVMGGVGLVLAV